MTAHKYIVTFNFKGVKVLFECYTVKPELY